MNTNSLATGYLGSAGVGKARVIRGVNEPDGMSGFPLRCLFGSGGL